MRPTLKELSVRVWLEWVGTLIIVAEWLVIATIIRRVSIAQEQKGRGLLLT
jgi:hypothetical protein